MGTIYKNGIKYGGGSGSSIFYGTQDEWEKLTPEEKKTYDYVAFD